MYSAWSLLWFFAGLWYARCQDLSLSLLTPHPMHCTYEYAFDMYGAHCAGLRLDHIPKLKTNIEILEFSDNKLRELNPETFEDYTNLKFLYLSDNQIYFIAEDAFVPLSYLQTLDLSKNVITEIPTSLFDMRYLRKLYLNGNPLRHLDLNIVGINQLIAAPLELLDLADCKIGDLPEWGILPQLTFYNISHNPLKGLKRNHFVGLCNLKNVDITSATDRIDKCNLESAIKWFQDKQIHVMLGNYTTPKSKDVGSCYVEEVSAELNATYQKCKTKFFQVPSVRTSRHKWLNFGGALAGFLFGFILLLYVMHRRSVIVSEAMEKHSKPSQQAGKRVLLENIS